jgi:hypothetical protein
MKKKIQLLGVAVMATMMTLLAFSGMAHDTAVNGNNQIVNNDSQIMSIETSGQNVLMNNSVAFLNQQEMHDLQKFMTYNLIHYGVHSNMLDKLQYKADLNFATWYIADFSQIPSSHRGITPQNSSIILPMWENESPHAKGDVQAVANYEVSQYTTQNEINTTYIVNNRLGNIVSNETTVYDNQSANLLVYKYTKDNQSLVYELIAQKGSFTPVDPYIRLNAFTIHWGWGGLISGTSYNIYFKFTNYNNALSFKDFLSSALTIKASVETAMTDIGWIIAGALVGSIAGPAGTVIGALVGVAADLISLYEDTNPTTIASTINGLFTNQEDYNGQFQVVYTLNAWEDGLVPEFSWWGYFNPGSVLTQIYKDVGLVSDAESDFITVYNYLAGMVGTNVQTYFSAPSSWSIVTYLIIN